MKNFTRSYCKILLEVIAALAMSSTVFAQVPQKTLTIGPKTNDNKAIKFNRNSSTPPQIRWLEGSSVLQFSNDGSTFFNFPSTAINLAVTTKTSNYTIVSTDDIVLADATGGAFTLTLPTASGNSGKVLYIVKIDTANNVNITGTVDTVSNPVITSVGQTLQIFSDGTNWRTINHKTKYVTSKTSNYTVALSDEVIEVDGSGGAFTVTLPSSSSSKGRTYIIKRTDDTPANGVTISGTVDGISSPILYTLNESYTLVSDGSAYKSSSHSANTAPVAYTPTFGGVGTATSISFIWWRNGGKIHVLGKYTWGTTSAAVPTISLPSGVTISSALPSGNVVIGDVASTNVNAGYYTCQTQASATTVQIGVSNGAVTGLASTNASAFGGAGGSGTTFSVQCEAPVLGWNP